MTRFNYKKSVQLLNLIAQKNGGKENKMKALKLIWLSDRLHLRRYGRTITGDQYFAMPKGPVASCTYNILQHDLSNLSNDELNYSVKFISMDGYDYNAENNTDLDIFSDSDIKAIEDIYIKYSHLDHWQLSDLSHEFPEWKAYEKRLKDGFTKRCLIDFNLFFKNIEDKSQLFVNDKEYLSLSQEIFEEQFAL